MSGLRFLLMIITTFKWEQFIFIDLFFSYSTTKRAVILVFSGGGKGWSQITKQKSRVCEAESARFHLHWAEQACWQGNTSGEGQQSTLWPCWRQWHNSNSCRVRASSFLSWVSFSLLQAAARARHRVVLQTKLTEAKSQNKTQVDGRAFVQEVLSAGSIIFLYF